MRNSKPLDLALVALCYFLLACFSAVWDWVSRGSPFQVWSSSTVPDLKQLLGSGLFVALYFLVSRKFLSWSSWGQSLEKLLLQLLTPISYFQIVSLALMSALVEEWFFRGILVAHFGTISSALFFGLCHLIPSARLWSWSLIAFGMGLVLGALYAATQSLWLCVWIHALLNAAGLFYLNLRAYSRPSFRNA